MKNIKKEKPKNDVHYVRVSSNEQVLGFSLDSQEKYCKETSTKDGYSVFACFREEGESAKTADRTELRKMMLFCDRNKKQISRLVVYKIDRLSRSVSDYQVLKMFFNKLGIIIVSATEHFKDDPAGKLNENILSAFAQFDNDVRSQRTIEGLKARLMKGLWSGVAPWGYINTLDTTKSKIIAPHPDRAPIVKFLFEQYATNKYSFKELADMVNKKGTKSRHGCKMSKQLVSKIVANPIYYGKMIVNKFEISIMGSHKPIITEKLFNEAQAVRNGVLDKGKPRNKDSPDYPLRGIKCYGCGKSISGGKTRSKTGRYYQYYGCVNGDCLKRTAIPKIEMENDFTDFLLKITPNEEYFDVLKEAIRIAHKTELDSVTDLERKLELKIAELKDKKDRLLNLIVDGKISDKVFIPANDKLEFEISELEKEISKLFTPELGLDNVIDSGIEFLKNFPKTWKVLDSKDLRVLRTLLFPLNLFYHYPHIKTPEVCCIYNVEPQFLNEKTCQVMF